MTETAGYGALVRLRYRWHGLKPASTRISYGDGTAEELAYFDTGPPRRAKRPAGPILLLHGFTADKECWFGMIARLAKKHRVVAPDLAGHGRTSKAADDDYTVARQAARARALVERLDPVLGRHHVLGHSMGGAVALRYAVDFPREVDSVGLIAPATAPKPHTEEFHRHLRGEAKPPLKVNPLVVSAGKGGEVQWSGAEKVRYVTNGPGWLHQGARLLNRHLTRMELERQELYTRIFGQLACGDEPVVHDDELQGLRQPTFIRWGTADRVLEPNPGYITSRMPADVPVDVEQWPGFGHTPIIEDGKKTALAYLGFLDRLPDPAGGS